MVESSQQNNPQTTDSILLQQATKNSLSHPQHQDQQSESQSHSQFMTAPEQVVTIEDDTKALENRPIESTEDALLKVATQAAVQFVKVQDKSQLEEDVVSTVHIAAQSTSASSEAASSIETGPPSPSQSTHERTPDETDRATMPQTEKKYMCGCNKTSD